MAAASSLGTLTLSLLAETGGYIGPLDQAERATLKAMKGMGAAVDEFGNYTDRTYKRIAQSAAQLDASYDSMFSNMQRQIALYGETSRASAMAFDIQKGHYKSLSEEQKASLMAESRRLDAMDDANAAFAQQTAAIHSLNTAQESLLASLQKEVTLQGDASRAASIRYDLSLGKLKELDGAKKSELLTEVAIIEARENQARVNAEAAKAAAQLNRTHNSLEESMLQELSLYGEVTRAAQLRYRIEQGDLRELDSAQSQNLLTLAEQLDSLSDDTENATGSFRGLRGVALSAGYQLQDVVVQLQAGTSAFMVISQQGSQFLSSFGMWGAIAGAVVAVAGVVGGVLFESFMMAQDAVKDLESNIAELTKSYADLSDVQRQVVDKGLAEVIADRTKEYEEGTKAIEDQSKALQELKDSGGLDLTFKNAANSALFLGAAIGKIATYGLVDKTDEMWARFSPEQDVLDKTKELTALTVAQVKAQRELEELKDVTGGTKVVNALEDEVELLGLQGKALHEATAAQKMYDPAIRASYVSLMLFKDAHKDNTDFKKRIKDLNEETIALQLKNAEIHKNVGLMDELAKKLADSKNTRADGTKIGGPEQQAELAAAEEYNAKLKQKNALDTESLNIFNQQDKAAKDRILSLQREIDLFGISSKAQQLEYDINSGLIKLNNDGSKERILQLTAELALKEKLATFAKADEEIAFAGYDNSKGDIESARMQYQLDNGLLEINKELTKEFYEQLIAKKKIAEGRVSDKKDQEDFAKMLENLDKSADSFGGAWSRTGSVIIDTFGSIADAMNDYLKMTETLAKREKEIAEAKALAATPKDIEEIAKREKKLAEDTERATISGYSKMASAASEMFKENSKGRKAMHAVEKTLAAIEIALAIKNTAIELGLIGTRAAATTAETSLNIAAGGAKMFAQSGWAGFAGVAAMIAVMASLGFSGSGGGGGGQSAEDIQAAQGTGTVMGDSSGKSESIANAFEDYTDIAIDQLSELRGIRSAMSALSSGIAGLAVSMVRSNKFSGAGVDLSGSQSLSIGGGFLDFMNLAPGGGDLLNKFLGDVFGKTTKKLVDTGLQMGAQDLGDVLAGDFEAFYYNTVKTTKKKLWGLSKKVNTKDEMTEVESGLADEFADIFGYMADAVEQSLTVLGVDAAQAIESFKISVGKISFQDLSGEEIQAELEAVFGAQADLLAEFVLPQIAEYQKMGEGAFETLMRVSKEQAVFNDALDGMGLNLSNLSGLMRLDIAQSIIGLMGGLEEFSSKTSDYFDKFFNEDEKIKMLGDSLTEAFSSIGQAVPTNRQAFRDIVEGLNLTTEADRELFASLMELAPALDEYIKATTKAADVVRSASDIANERYNLEIRQLEALGQAAEVLAIRRQKELEGLDASNRQLLLDIYAIEDYNKAMAEKTKADQDAANALKQAAKDVFEVLRRSISAEKERIQSIVSNASDAKGELDSAIGREREALSAAHEARLEQLSQQSNAAKEAAQQMANADYEARRAIAKAQQEATKDQLKLLEDSVSGLAKLFEDLNGAIEDMTIMTDELFRSRRRAAEFEIDTAILNARQGRGVPTDGRIQEALQILRDNPTSLYGSFEEMAYSTAVTQNKLQDLAKLTEAQKTIEEQTIEVLRAQLAAQELAYDSIEKRNVEAGQASEELIALEKLRFEGEMANLDAMAEDARKQFDKLSGIDTTLLTLNQAQEAFAKAMLAADFENAKAEIESLESIESIASKQLDRLQGIEVGVLQVEDALRWFLTTVDLATRKEDPKAGQQTTSSLLDTYNALLDENRAMREESYNLNRAILKNTQDSADTLMRMEEEGLSV